MDRIWTSHYWTVKSYYEDGCDTKAASTCRLGPALLRAHRGSPTSKARPRGTATERDLRAP